MKRLEEIKARAEAATEGPWKAVRTQIANDIYGRKHIGHITYDANADFIAHSRTDIPALVEALEVAVRALTEISDDIHTMEETIYCSHADEALKQIEEKLGE